MDEIFNKLGIMRSNISIIGDRDTAKRMALKNNKLVILGDENKYWICANNRDAGTLKKAGYKIINPNTI